MAGVPIGPRNIHTRAGLNVDLYINRLFSRIQWCGHSLENFVSVLGLSVAAFARRNGIAVWARLGVAQERADALIQFRADDVFEPAGLIVRFRVVTANVSLNNRSASRCRRMTPRARWLPTGVSCASPFCNSTKCRSLMRPRIFDAGSFGSTGRLPAGPLACSDLINAGLPPSQHTQICSRR